MPKAVVDTKASAPRALALAELRPMLLDETKQPFSDPAWAFEVKYDGYRTLAEWGSSGARLQSRHGNDVSRWFGEVTSSLAAIGGKRCVGDGVAVYTAAVQLQLEGIVAKKLDAPYQPGVRSRDWLKIKRPGAVPAERFKH
jgi:ATP-dependent DNA ligase